MVIDYQLHTYYTLLVTLNITITLVIMLAACLCCKKKVPKNELLGLEGMVKLKNPDEVVVITADAINATDTHSHTELNASTVSNADSEKRSSTAAHRSLPDIPVAEAIGDNGSELYATVADKAILEAQLNQDKSHLSNLKKQISVSQHSSISQADDLSSPYSRVKNSPHDYAKVRSAEHPYAQLNAPPVGSTATGLTGGAPSTSQLALNNESLNRNSHHSNSSQNNEEPMQAAILAASAIAGMISASQDLPYMTPPITNQHFSGDSQDSSKGYTSISVREPLANILAQQPAKNRQRSTLPLARSLCDSHYATVSDDSDETYAAIEDPNAHGNPTDIYTSGSETYAQIQPLQMNSIVVAVEINNSSLNTTSISLPNAPIMPIASHSAAVDHNSHVIARPTNEHITPVPHAVDSLRAQMHSRQASSSSNNSSSMGNLGSPKPEKRQANSPLPPTPKSNALQHQLHANNSSNSNLTSGRNSVISVIEHGSLLETSGSSGTHPNVANTIINSDNSPMKKNKSLSPSKDIEGMYAKVMKKNKFSRNASSSQNNSPILGRKYNNEQGNNVSLGISPLDNAASELMEGNKIGFTNTDSTAIDNSRVRSNSFSAKDHGYETIPADGIRAGPENRKSDCYAHILQKERKQEAYHGSSVGGDQTIAISGSKTKAPAGRKEKHYETIANSIPINRSDPNYETLLKPHNSHRVVVIEENEKKSSDYDPNYEVVKNPNNSLTEQTNSAGLSDDGYAKVVEKKQLNLDEDSADGYSKVKGEECEDGAIAGYSTIGEPKVVISSDANHNYASIMETKGDGQMTEVDSDHYARIAETHIPPAPNLLLFNSVSTLTKSTDMPMTSPSSVNSSVLNNSSVISSTHVTSTMSNSTSTSMSSRPTPTSSQYESLTGSETDPNYESVCYTNTTTSRDNPYERLQPDYTDTQLSGPVTPDDTEQCSTSTTAVGSDSLPSPSKTKPNQNETANPDIVVDDYFQV